MSEVTLVTCNCSRCGADTEMEEREPAAFSAGDGLCYDCVMRERRKRKILNWSATIGVVVVSVAGAALTGHRAAAKEMARLEATIVQTHVDDESVSEVGYIIGMEDKINWQEERDAGWWVKVPSDIYWCSWEGGYRGFRKNDPVRLIHKRKGLSQSDLSGYVVGLSGIQYGRAAAVSAEHEFDAMLDARED